MANKPKNIVFDVGNVLIRWDMRALYSKIFDSDQAMEQFFADTSLTSWNIEQDRGRGWDDAEAVLIGQFPHYEQPIRAFRARWHETVTGSIDETIALKDKLKAQGASLYAITNFASDTFKETQQRFPTLTDFIDIVVSAEEKLIKPDPAIYQVLLQRNGLLAEDCLFIDDSLPNVEGARSVGMIAHHFSDPALLADDLRRLGYDI